MSEAEKDTREYVVVIDGNAAVSPERARAERAEAKLAAAERGFQEESRRWADRWARVENRALVEVFEERAERAEAALAEALDVMRQGHAAVEHLRDCDLAGTHDADADVVLAFLNAHDDLIRKTQL